MAIGDELGFIPKINNLDDVLRLREHRGIKQFRKLFGELNSAIKKTDQQLIKEIRDEIVKSKSTLNRLEFTKTRSYIWVTTILGFLPVIGNVLGLVDVALYEVDELIKKKHDWVYMGIRE